MNWYPLLGLLALVYAGLVVFIALKKPVKIWNMGKIQLFIKLLGEKGTEIFFYVFAVVFLGLGIWLFTL
ncbi:MAG: hypothetical protein CL609_14900 [Anaerolineaceae bacterium]|nr:hypothetical protein [Anaerolineaceae bacterium]